jgi:hypothetical protein
MGYFILGAICGAILSVVVCACCSIAGREDDQQKEQLKNEQHKWLL